MDNEFDITSAETQDINNKAKEKAKKILTDKEKKKLQEDILNALARRCLVIIITIVIASFSIVGYTVNSERRITDANIEYEILKLKNELLENELTERKSKLESDKKKYNKLLKDHFYESINNLQQISKK